MPLYHEEDLNLISEFSNARAQNSINSKVADFRGMFGNDVAQLQPELMFAFPL